ncbi:MAG: 50S ribosomal protein L25 [Phaeodactylibacter sp.]|nr:50S ribosomal protein L25 [Phaeodactylibacter sp.]MCB9301976.1 50S ribosomal protein L25 [Lewinellaceae bacterium]HQU58518.1 50S ribosomal protein L25 [Saprospiraceae bacterium]
MEIVAVKGQLRPGLGKKVAKSVRNEGRIPCVLYGGDEIVHFSTVLKEIKAIVYTPDFKVAELAIDGKSYRAILKEVQWHPVTDNIIHIDFLRLVEGHPIKIEIPLRFKGVSPGVRAGGKLQQKLRRVLIKAMPEHVVGEMTVDISKLELGQSIRVRDIVIEEEGVEILNSPGVPVATIEIPRALRSATAAAEKAAGTKK